MGRAVNKRSFPTVDGIEKCREVLHLLRSTGPYLTVRQLNYCDEACIRRFLKAKGNDLKKAAKQLRATLSWRANSDVDNLTADEFPAELAAGHAFVAGLDDEGQPVVVLKFKPEHAVVSQAQQQFFRYFVFTMEVAISCMPASVEQCTVILDAGYLNKGASGFSTMVQVLKLLSDHYPERVTKAFVVDAPSMFYYLWKGIGGFFSKGMKEKLKFVYSRHYNTKSASANRLANVHTSCLINSEKNNHNELGASDQFDLSNTSSSSNMHSSGGQSVSNCSSFRICSSSSSSSSTTASLSSSSGSSFSLDKSQARSFSFATSCTNREHTAAAVEFRSFRGDSKCMDVDDGYSSARWADLSFSSSSTIQGPKTEDALEIDQHTPHFGKAKALDASLLSKAKGRDAFLLYYHHFFVLPYSEADYRAKMKAPLGGLVAIVSPDVKSPHACFSFHGRAMEAMLHHLTFD